MPFEKMEDIKKPIRSGTGSNRKASSWWIQKSRGVSALGVMRDCDLNFHLNLNGYF